MPHSTNQLIARLPPEARLRLDAIGEVVGLAFSAVLGQPGTLTRHVHFPVDGFISLLSQIDDEHVMEVGMVGREGMLGVQVALGVANDPWRSLVQGEGRALRITAAEFRAEIARTPALRLVVDRYVVVLLAQHARAAACLRFHRIEERLARWLLMSQDRAGTASFHLTQEFLAYMLGVRRVSVTVAASSLQRQRLIAYERGRMTIVDREGLERAACSCYSSDCAAYREVWS